jgi:peptide/nickel transport system permease protein
MGIACAEPGIRHGPDGRSYWRLVWRQFRRRRLAVAGLAVVAALGLVALLAPVLANDRPLVLWRQDGLYLPALVDSPSLQGVDFSRRSEVAASARFVLYPPVPYSPTQYDLDRMLEAPSRDHWLGTDDRGRDVASRMIHGSRTSLSVGFVAVGIYLAIGILLGALAGFYGGAVDMVISRLYEIMICFPTFFLILAIMAFLPPSIFNVMVVIGATGWTGVARLVRGEFLKLRAQDFVTASRALGAKDSRVIFRHVLPNALAPVLVSATFGVAGAVLVESSLSFLGFGVPPPTPSWGDILSQSRAYIDFAWWLTLFPGLAIFLTVTAYNLVGEGLRDAVDPRLKTE